MRQTSRFGIQISEETLRRLRAHVDREGDAYRAAVQLGIGFPALARALAGLGVRGATATAIEARLDQLEAASALAGRRP